MSSTDTPAISAASSNTITVPPGVTVQPGRQTSQVNAQGVVVQGTLYGIQLANGTISSVFVPTSIETQLAQVQALFENKVAALQAVPVS